MGDESLRETIEAVYNESKGAGDAAPSGQDSSSHAQSVGPDRQPTAAADVSGGSAGHAGDGSRSAPKGDSETGSRARDDGGRFVKAERGSKGVLGKETSETQAPKAGVPTVTDAPKEATATATEAPKTATTTETKPPQSLRPSFREKAEWSKLPPEWQQEMTRWEATVKSGLAKAAEAEKAANPYREAVAQFEPMFKAQGLEPTKAIAGLAQMWGQLNSGNAQQTDSILANLARRFGSNPERIAQAFQAPAQFQQPRQQMPDVAKLVEQKIAERLEAAQSAQIEKEIAEFGETHEFFEDVRADMGAMAAAMEQRGVAINFEDLYTKAIALNPEISAIMKQKEAAKAVATSIEATQRTRAAASSVRSSHSAPAAIAPGKNTRDTVAEVYRELSGK